MLFYIVLPSSMNYFSENTTSHFITQLPKQIRLQGSWSVALTEVQIPLTFQHVSSEALDRTVSLTRISHSALETNQIRTVKFNAIESMVRPGIYKDIDAIVSEINNLNCTKNHVEFRVERGGYVTCARVCAKATCYQLSHQLFLSKKLQKILGFKKMNSILIKDQESIEDDRPAHLANGSSRQLLLTHVHTAVIQLISDHRNRYKGSKRTCNPIRLRHSDRYTLFQKT